MALSSDIRLKVGEYLAGRDLEELQNWLLPIFLDIDRSGDQDAIVLSHALQSQISDFSEGLLSENELKCRLAGMIGQAVALSPIVISYFVVRDNRDWVVSTSTDSQPLPAPRLNPMNWWGMVAAQQLVPAS